MKEPIYDAVSLMGLQRMFTDAAKYAEVVNSIFQLYLTDIEHASLEMLTDPDRVVRIPILDDDLMATLEFFDEGDVANFNCVLGNFMDFCNINVAILENTAEATPDMMDFDTPYILTLSRKEAKEFEDDEGDGDDGGGGGGTTVNGATFETPKEPPMTMAMAAGVGAGASVKTRGGGLFG